jgi:hypothetical protein
MGYGYAETFLIIFLTHPGVIIPTAGSAVNKAMSYVPAEIADAIPKDLLGFPPIVSGLWQVFWAWVLSLPGNKGPAFAWTMYSLYLFFLLIYMYFVGRIRFMQGI